MANVEFDIIREDEGRVRIVPKMGRLPKLEEYREVARRLLENGFSSQRVESLKDSSSRDFMDTMGLIQEFKEDFNSGVKVVVFSYRDGDVRVTADNISQIHNIVKRAEQNGANKYGTHRTAIKEAVAEALQK